MFVCIVGARRGCIVCAHELHELPVHAKCRAHVVLLVVEERVADGEDEFLRLVVARQRVLLHVLDLLELRVREPARRPGRVVVAVRVVDAQPDAALRVQRRERQAGGARGAHGGRKERGPNGAGAAFLSISPCYFLKSIISTSFYFYFSSPSYLFQLPFSASLSISFFF